MKKLIPLYIIITLIFTILYIFLAAKPLAKEYQFTPIWKISTANPAISEANEGEKLRCFHLGQTLGYFTEDGRISFFKTFPDRVAISDNYFALYDSQAIDIPFYNNKGQEVGTIKASGYPFFKDDMIYVFLPGGSSFSKCDESGNVSWTYEGILPITAFSAKKKYTAVGFADGTIKVFNNTNGAVEINFAPGGSDYPIILGLDISSDGQYVAAISGHNQQRFTLSRREDNQQKIIYHTFLDTDTPHRTLVHFCKNGNRVLYNYQGAVGIYDLRLNKNTVIPIKDKVISIKENDNFVYMLSKNKSKYTVAVIEKTDTLEGTFTFESDSAFISTDGDNLYIGKDNTISRLSVSQE
ncbi:MAG: WD40 repeat domain-containing protein [Treponema sp.]|nr:WD40 repeat domain-containing protein [Treponema sp.]